MAAAARSLATTKFRNAGQVCISPTRFLVERPIYDEFVEGPSSWTMQPVCGSVPGLDEGVQMGPMAVERRRRGVLEIIDQTVVAGATLRCGERRCPGPGWSVAPTVLTEFAIISAAMKASHSRPSRDHQPVRDRRGSPGQANRLPVGLAAYVFSGSPDRAASLVARIEAGTVGVNTGVIVHRDSPLSGIKNSGYGSDGGLEGMHELLQHVKAISTVPGARQRLEVRVASAVTSPAIPSTMRAVVLDAPGPPEALDDPRAPRSRRRSRAGCSSRSRPSA